MQIRLAEQVFLCTERITIKSSWVKNLRWNLAHDAIAGTLPWYFRTTTLRSAMARTVWYGFTGCATLAGRNTVAVDPMLSPRCFLRSKSKRLR